MRWGARVGRAIENAVGLRLSSAAMRMLFCTALALQLTITMTYAQDVPGVVEPGAAVEKVGGGYKFIEGPVWFDADGGYLLFSDIPADTMYKWSLRGGFGTFRQPSGRSNGNTLDREGRLITCEHANRRVSRTEKDGSVVTLAETFNGKRLNSPNDVAVKSDGSIWFTDPPYGLENETVGKELDKNSVYVIPPGGGDPYSVLDDQQRPNGLCFSPDEKRIYIAESFWKIHEVWVYDVVEEDGRYKLANAQKLITIDNGVPDGMRVASDGTLLSSAGDGVHVIRPDGTLLGKIKTPETITNLCFGGPEGKTLFMTGAKGNLYRVQLNVSGAGVSLQPR
jgi:gluconolactonase